jgi:hypothetical protein
MKQKLQALIKAVATPFKKLLNFIPTPLPVGMTEFDNWAADIISTYGLPNNDSIRFALATMIMHAGPVDASRSKRYFYLAVRASMAKQIAGGQFQAIKERDLAARAQKQAEATAMLAVASDAQPVQK